MCSNSSRQSSLSGRSCFSRASGMTDISVRTDLDPAAICSAEERVLAEQQRFDPKEFVLAADRLRSVDMDVSLVPRWIYD